MSFKKIVKPYKPLVHWDKIKLVVFDCDGVLTDGKIIYNSAGTEVKNFYSQDGLGFRLLREAGVHTAVVTGRTSTVLERRCQDMKIEYLYQGIAHKVQKINELLQELELDWDCVLMMGDDWNDLPAMFKAAVSVCPADAVEDIKQLADYVTSHTGGHGAVRECVELVLNNKGIYEQALLAYLNQIS
ncbi:MAG TPA: HAD hydrolase family protein [Candidatus Cloacimonadota bacterium]|mgnify:CR=1 FL=1|nr:HAD hydrolase family protein [Candidatus Cloacimonadota bacterium]HOF59159.1 HAD hydrolase family protein [Candidatus Cloacimonadota bacterium]HOR58042.1 HAD hydrolase family protein [Candidatus Cloacimonadota bacterium]HPB08238.1 HAD hydrolase family protein [Candidatus Cloacimonadota bacterium]HPL22899.1 HAD hydrolase family protein [Candidatus Cloacimonadota bacterium]